MDGHNAVRHMIRRGWREEQTLETQETPKNGAESYGGGTTTDVKSNKRRTKKSPTKGKFEKKSLKRGALKELLINMMGNNDHISRKVFTTAALKLGSTTNSVKQQLMRYAKEGLIELDGDRINNGKHKHASSTAFAAHKPAKKASRTGMRSDAAANKKALESVIMPASKIADLNDDINVAKQFAKMPVTRRQRIFELAKMIDLKLIKA